jgi:RNA polymerase sigma-70 factor (ECF subfamily)
MNRRTPASLLLRVRDFGDQKSWDEFVALYGPIILRYLRRVGVPRQEALDLVQDVLGIIVRHIGSFQYDPGLSFRAWLRKVATNRAYRFFAQQGREPASPGGSSHAAAVQQVPGDDRAEDELIEQEWRRRRLEMALERVRTEVKPQTWQAFQLNYLQGLAPSDVASQLDMNIGAVYTGVCRVLARLRKAVEEIDE